ncbi:MAG TPA: A/G-specific adenine glycosylase [Salinimicrobium sp.]|nr:A/G-specific adenine glycosylase [Salinimicrobium sp.]
MNFSKTLINWYLENKRQLPWRETSDPYKIWLSEIILQQTRVEQGKPYYFKFIEYFPDVFSLANATEEEVLKLWQGLGYYSRARNLLFTAKHIAFQLNGIFPDSYKELIKLKGIGDYTASAIASFSFNEPAAAVDGNVYRVLSRIFGISTPINSAEGAKEFKQVAQKLIDPDNPGTFNQAIIEFGSEQCKPRLPLCPTCPFSSQCVAFQQNRITELPVKLKKLTIQKRHFNYLVFISEGKKTMLKKRNGKGIWQGLYEFPLVETFSESGKENLVQDEEFLAYLPAGNPKMVLFNEKPIVHKLTHQHIHTKFWILNCEELPQEGISIEEIEEFPVPALISNFIDSYGF